MTVAEILIINKDKYNKSFLLTNDSDTNGVVFTPINENTLTDSQSLTEAKDYFLLDSEGIDEIFGKASELDLKEEDNILIIGI